MPTVPRVSPAPLPGARFDPSAPAAAFRGAPPVDTSGVQQVGLDLYREHQRLVEEERHKADQIAITSAGSDLSTAKSDLLYNPQGGALTRRGQNAFGAPEDARTAFEKASSAIRAKLVTDEQRVQFDRIAANDWNEIDIQVQRHVAAERQRYDTETTDSFITNKRNEAVAAWQDPAAIQSSIDYQQAAITDHAQRNGLAGEWAKEQAAKAASATHLSVIEQMLQNGADRTAERYLAQHRGQIVGPDLLNAERLTEAGSVRGDSQRTADDILAGRFAPGMVETGNIDLTNRPRVQNPDGTISTVRSISVGIDGREVLIPTVSDAGKILTNEQAIEQFQKTGKHLGIFADPASATAYAQQIHADQAALVAGQAPRQQQPVTLTEALSRAAQIQDPRVREATEQRIRRHYEDIAADRRQQQAQNFQTAGEIVEKTGDHERIPLPMWLSLDVHDREALLRREDQVRHPKVADNGDTYVSLMNMAGLSDASRSHFETLDLGKYRGKVTESEFKQLLSLQTTERRQTSAGISSEARRVSAAETAEQKRAAAAAEKAKQKEAEAEKARAALKAMGVDIGPAVPGAPIHKPAAAAPVGQAMAPGGKVPQAWLDRAKKDQNYRLYLEHMGVKVPD